MVSLVSHNNSPRNIGGCSSRFWQEAPVARFPLKTYVLRAVMNLGSEDNKIQGTDVPDKQFLV